MNTNEVTAQATNNAILIPERSTDILATLQQRLDNAERNQTKVFADFSDMDMIQWFLYHSKHLEESRGRTERSTAAYKRELEQFCTYLPTYAVEIGIDIEEIQDGSLFKSLQPRHLRLYQQWLKERSPYIIQRKKTYSMATLERKTTVIRMFFKYLYEVGYLAAPLHQELRIAVTNKEDRPNRDMYPRDVVRVLEAFVKTKNIFMFTLTQVLVTTGMRNEELCTLTVGSLKKNPLHDGYYLSVHGKGNKMRDIPLKEKVVRSIMMFRSMRGLPSITVANKADPLFTTGRGNAYTPSYLDKVFQRELQKISPELDGQSLHITPHVFRHAFAIISRVNNVDVYEIMRSLGHEKIETTMIYLEKIFEKENHASMKWHGDTLGNFI